MWPHESHVWTGPVAASASTSSRSRNSNNLEFDDVTALEERLREADVPLDVWGVGAAKRVADLHQELQLGHCALVDEDGGLQRVARIVRVAVKQNSQVLVETCQRMKTGEVRVRLGLSEVLTKARGERLTGSTHRGRENRAFECI